MTTDGTLKLAPVFISNGDEVVFATHEIPNLVSIVALKLSDGSRRRLHPTSRQPSIRPGLLARRALSRVRPIGDVPADGAGDPGHAGEERHRLPPARIASDRANPSFCARRLARCLQPFRHRRSPDRLGQPRGEDLKYLTKAAGMNAWPAYSPDGRKIAFGSSRSGDFEIYVMNADGSDVVAAHPKPGPGRAPGLVARRQEDRLHEQSRRELRNLCHERRWITSCATPPRTPPGTIIPPGTPTAGGCFLFPIATAALTFILVRHRRKTAVEGPTNERSSLFTKKKTA